ncbi:hypothetical protein FKG94_28055 [Exilibacterium tricleocarpae]|uniref:Uncharacterized protein n=1 Tax=Exilibacterium tricleocarpae TaxID=2591008 RepID=A0A545SLG5_9GAMM|nr:hypothetical protein [Exilibacterium tricleocarpae]TQV65823.1 hypothetical protein FKG94_28055 [Exilibacterium tricleocarpae]
MPDSTILVNEFNIIWEALNHYEKYLENMSASAPNEDEELLYDEKLQDLENTKKAIQYAALNSYGLELKAES